MIPGQNGGPEMGSFKIRPVDAAGGTALLAAGSERIVHGLGPLYRVHANATYDTLVRDGLGSVRLEVSGAGRISAAYDYTAYGAIRAASATPLLGFAGELHDPSGLTYLRARWYDPGTGRLQSRDSFPGVQVAPWSLNAYLYGRGSPTRWIDPTGLWTGALCIAANFSAGGYGTYQLCPIVVTSNGEIGWTATIGAGLSPSLAVSATGGLQGSNANRISDLTGPFNQVGGSAGMGVVGGADYFWSDDTRVQGVSAMAGFGGRLTGFAPVEVHAARTDTLGGTYFNVFGLFDVFRGFFKPGTPPKSGAPM